MILTCSGLTCFGQCRFRPTCRRRVAPNCGAPKGGERPKISCFFPLPPHFSSFLPLLRVFRGILVVCEAPGTFGVLGLSCEALASRGVRGAPAKNLEHHNTTTPQHHNTTTPQHHNTTTPPQPEHHQNTPPHPTPPHTTPHHPTPRHTTPHHTTTPQHNTTQHKKIDNLGQLA